MAGLTRRIASRWERTILVCGKCSKKVDGGFGDKGRTPLAKALRRALSLKKGRKAQAGIVEVKCLGICPRARIVVVDAAEPGRWHLIAPATPLIEVARALSLDQA